MSKSYKWNSSQCLDCVSGILSAWILCCAIWIYLNHKFAKPLYRVKNKAVHKYHKCSIVLVLIKDNKNGFPKANLRDFRFSTTKTKADLINLFTYQSS